MVRRTRSGRLRVGASVPYMTQAREKAGDIAIRIGAVVYARTVSCHEDSKRLTVQSVCRWLLCSPCRRVLVGYWQEVPSTACSLSGRTKPLVPHTAMDLVARLYCLTSSSVMRFKLLVIVLGELAHSSEEALCIKVAGSVEISAL